MKIRRSNNFYVLDDYFRQEIDLDTAKDARHLVSVLSSFCPDINLTFEPKKVKCNNVCNHMHQKLVISWKYEL